MTSPAESFIVPTEARDDASREPKDMDLELALRFELPLDLSTSDGETGVLDCGDERRGRGCGLDEAECRSVVEGAEEVVLVCLFRG